MEFILRIYNQEFSAYFVVVDIFVTLINLVQRLHWKIYDSFPPAYCGRVATAGGRGILLITERNPPFPFFYPPLIPLYPPLIPLMLRGTILHPSFQDFPIEQQSASHLKPPVYDVPLFKGGGCRRQSGDFICN